MSPTPIDVSMVTCAGRFRDNRRGVLRIQALGPSFVQLVIDQPPHFGTPGTRTSITMAGQKVSDVAAQLRELAEALDDVTDLEAWRKYEPAEDHSAPWQWQQHPDEREASA